MQSGVVPVYVSLASFAWSKDDLTYVLSHGIIPQRFLRDSNGLIRDVSSGDAPSATQRSAAFCENPWVTSLTLTASCPSPEEHLNMHDLEMQHKIRNMIRGKQVYGIFAMYCPKKVIYNPLNGMSRLIGYILVTDSNRLREILLTGAVSLEAMSDVHYCPVSPTDVFLLGTRATPVFDYENHLQLVYKTDREGAYMDTAAFISSDVHFTYDKVLSYIKGQCGGRYPFAENPIHQTTRADMLFLRHMMFSVPPFSRTNVVKQLVDMFISQAQPYKQDTESEMKQFQHFLSEVRKSVTMYAKYTQDITDRRAGHIKLFPAVMSVKVAEVASALTQLKSLDPKDVQFFLENIAEPVVEGEFKHADIASAILKDATMLWDCHDINDTNDNIKHPTYHMGSCLSTSSQFREIRQDRIGSEAYKMALRNSPFLTWGWDNRPGSGAHQATSMATGVSALLIQAAKAATPLFKRVPVSYGQATYLLSDECSETTLQQLIMNVPNGGRSMEDMDQDWAQSWRDGKMFRPPSSSPGSLHEHVNPSLNVTTLVLDIDITCPQLTRRFWDSYHRLVHLTNEETPFHLKLEHDIVDNANLLLHKICPGVPLHHAVYVSYLPLHKHVIYREENSHSRLGLHHHVWMGGMHAITTNVASMVTSMLETTRVRYPDTIGMPITSVYDDIYAKSNHTCRLPFQRKPSQSFVEYNITEHDNHDEWLDVDYDEEEGDIYFAHSGEVTPNVQGCECASPNGTDEEHASLIPQGMLVPLSDKYVDAARAPRPHQTLIHGGTPTKRLYILSNIADAIHVSGSRFVNYIQTRPKTQNSKEETLYKCLQVARALTLLKEHPNDMMSSHLIQQCEVELTTIYQSHIHATLCQTWHRVNAVAFNRHKDVFGDASTCMVKYDHRRSLFYVTFKHGVTLYAPLCPFRCHRTITNTRCIYWLFIYRDSKITISAKCMKSTCKGKWSVCTVPLPHEYSRRINCSQGNIDMDKGIQRIK